MKTLTEIGAEVRQTLNEVDAVGADELELLEDLLHHAIYQIDEELIERLMRLREYALQLQAIVDKIGA